MADCVDGVTSIRLSEFTTGPVPTNVAFTVWLIVLIGFGLYNLRVWRSR